MKTLPQSLIDLAKAFDGGDDSAFEPLIDCLLENGYDGLPAWIWELWKGKRRRSGFIPWIFDGTIDEAEQYLSGGKSSMKNVKMR